MKMTSPQDDLAKSNKKSVIAVSGKGGTGKTVVSTIIIKHLKKRDMKILAIDADPATSLPPALGVSIKKTIGDIRETLVKGPGRGPTTDLPVDLMLEYQIRGILAEIPKISILAIGRPEGPGCYCLVNDILRHAIEKFSGYYDVTVIDCEAGLEHLSRRTTRSVDTMIIVTDATQRGINTAKLIKELAESLEINFDKIYVILNRASEEQARVFSESASKYGIELAGIVPYDQNITEYDLAGKPLIDLPDDSPAVIAVGEILHKLEILVSTFDLTAPLIQFLDAWRDLSGSLRFFHISLSPGVPINGLTVLSSELTTHIIILTFSFTLSMFSLMKFTNGAGLFSEGTITTCSTVTTFNASRISDTNTIDGNIKSWSSLLSLTALMVLLTPGISG